MEHLQFLKPEMAVLIPILCFLRGRLKSKGCKRHADAFFYLFALLLATGYVLTTSRIEDCAGVWQAVWLGAGQGMACIAVCSFTCGREKRRRTGGTPAAAGAKNKKPRVPRGW